MKTPFRMLLGAAALSAAVCVSSGGFAQAPPPPGAMAASPDARHDRWADHMREEADAKARALHDILNVRPDQDAAFQAMVASMPGPGGRPDMGADMRHEHDEMASMTTPQRLDRMLAKMAEHQAEFQRHADAVRAFYAVLGPDQRRAFDALTGMIMEDHHGMGEGPMMGGHGPHGGPED